MSTVSQGLARRTAWSAFALLSCIYSIYAASTQSVWAQLAFASGWALYAVAWFLQPPYFSFSAERSLRRGAALLVGSPALRTSLGVTALALLLLGFTLRAISGA